MNPLRWYSWLYHRINCWMDEHVYEPQPGTIRTDAAGVKHATLECRYCHKVTSGYLAVGSYVSYL